MLLHEQYIDQVVEKVVSRLQSQGVRPGGDPGILSETGSRSVTDHKNSGYGAEEGLGVFGDVDEAIEAAITASQALSRFPLSKRGFIIGQMRALMLDNLEFLARLAHRETGMGRVADKIEKNRLVVEKTPGIEDLTTGAFTGDKGITLDEYAPYGVIGAIIPSTNPTETVINNGISMFAAGNSVIFNPHPGATKCSLAVMSMLNRVIIDHGGPENCFVAVSKPTIESAEKIMHHPKIPFLAVTGAEGVVRAAMASGKKVAAAGPGNPPAVVDQTADLASAAKDIVSGGSLDNGIICIAEKVTVVVESVADQLIKEMENQGCFLASVNQVRMLEKELFAETPKPGVHTPVKRQYVGKDARVLLEAVGIAVTGDPRLVLVDVPKDSPFAWTEMLMPVMPVVRVPDVDAAIEYAVQVERGNRHTASMHSKNIDKLTEMGRRMNCTVYVKNGPTYSGLGMGGEGYTSFTIASPTGDGLTTARTFSRKRRCSLVGNYGIV